MPLYNNIVVDGRILSPGHKTNPVEKSPTQRPPYYYYYYYYYFNVSDEFNIIILYNILGPTDKMIFYCPSSYYFTLIHYLNSYTPATVFKLYILLPQMYVCTRCACITFYRYKVVNNYLIILYHRI